MCVHHYYHLHILTLLGSLLEAPGCSGLCFCFFFFFSFFFFFLSLSSSFFFFLCFFSCMSVPSAEPSCVGVSPGRYLCFLCFLCLRCPGGWFMKRYCSGRGPGWRRNAANCHTNHEEEIILVILCMDELSASHTGFRYFNLFFHPEHVDTFLHSMSNQSYKLLYYNLNIGLQHSIYFNYYKWEWHNGGR